MDAQDKDVVRRRFSNGQRWTGLLLLIIGGGLLLRQTGFPMPEWLFSWPMILIIVGFFVGLRHRFHDFSWLIMMLVGGVFLADRMYPNIQIMQYTVPGFIIFVGLMFVLSPKSKRFCNNNDKRERMRRRFRERFEHRFGPEDASGIATPVRQEQGTSTDPVNSSVDIVSVFSGVKKKILSKNFQGGEVTCIFGGAELNLTNADFTSPITIEFVQIFGGTKLIVPANWEVRSEVAAVFGGIEDKRPQPPNTIAERTLILNGTVLFGGVEVNSF